MTKWYFDNRIEAVQAVAGCFLTTLKRCLGVLRLPLGQPGDFHDVLASEQVSQAVQKSVASFAEHAGASAGIVVSAKAKDGL